MNNELRVGVIGAGLIGLRRIKEIVLHPDTKCVIVADTDEDAAIKAATMYDVDEITTNWQIALSQKLDIVVVSTPNGYLSEIACAALEKGCHVLVEKPMGRNVKEARQMQTSSLDTTRRLKVGFNHRYHPAIAKAHTLVSNGEIGDIINIRCRYGHGGRPGYESEWRGNRELSGGGELTDQGVHVVDLIHWFAGVPQRAMGAIQTAVWPLGDLEDNGFGMFFFESGAVAQFHTSWTQWKNLFSFEVFGTKGSVIVEGLGKSYGVETLTIHKRKLSGGVPDTEVFQYNGEDTSWKFEWEDFIRAIRYGSPMLGTDADGVIAMRMIDSIYRSAQLGGEVTVSYD